MAQRGITSKQAAAIDALMSARTVGDAAAAAGVHRNTLRAWLRDAQFCTALRAATDDAIGQSARRLATLTGQAVGVLGDGMNGDASGVQLRAADLVIGHAARLAELRDLTERVAALEARATNDQPKAAG
jgi:hypothetical protein